MSPVEEQSDMTLTERSTRNPAGAEERPRLAVRVKPAQMVAAIVAVVAFPPLGLVAAWGLVRAHRLGKTDPSTAIKLRNKASRLVTHTFGIGATIYALLFVYALLATNNYAVSRAFLDLEVLRDTLPMVLEGFVLNIQLFLTAEVFILLFGTLLAILRTLPGRPAALIRWLTAAYIDVFRGLPSIVVILIVVYGLKRTNLPLLNDLSDFWYVVIALTLHYSAYTAEVIKGGTEGIHWSQTAASRSLGLSHGQTMRFVILPQAMRNMFAPLLNYFIGLQKDTSLVTVIGLLDAVNQANIQAINQSSLSAFTGAALCFLAITIPLTRLADYLSTRRRRRELARG
ncbi:amino acid ABC transporter permease [Streptosporangium sp. NPDC006007]|uniref:amino acid ABC transporter permease n=1 Tax=Streptosporangium sp. NPDC006007 TaxID=3154575 RepID=UPI0033A18EBC